MRGFDAATIERLRPHVTALPATQPQGRTPVNVNTASEVVLAAILEDKVPQAVIAERVAARRAKPLQSAGEIAQWAAKASPAALGDLGVKSDFFAVRIHVAQDDVRVAADALLQRNPQNGATGIVWRRPLL